MGGHLRTLPQMRQSGPFRRKPLPCVDLERERFYDEAFEGNQCDEKWRSETPANAPGDDLVAVVFIQRSSQLDCAAIPRDAVAWKVVLFVTLMYLPMWLLLEPGENFVCSLLVASLRT